MAVRRAKYMAERRHIINNLHQVRSSMSLHARRSTADAIFKCSLNKRSQFPVPLSVNRQHAAAATSNGAQVGLTNSAGHRKAGILHCVR